MSRQYPALKGPCERDNSHLHRGYNGQMTESPPNAGNFMRPHDLARKGEESFKMDRDGFPANLEHDMRN